MAEKTDKKEKMEETPQEKPRQKSILELVDEMDEAAHQKTVRMLKAAIRKTPG